MPHPLGGEHQPGASFLEGAGFRILCEIEPPTRPDIERVREQIEVLAPACDAFVVPDNHLGRATVSSIAVAHEVAHLGGRSVACINARDRNLLGLRRDLLTAAAYGVDHFLLVHGDDPAVGVRSGDLNVRTMLDEVRTSTITGTRFRAGAVARAGRSLPAWKRAADFLVVQLSFDVDALVGWRETIEYDGPVFAGVLVLASAAMAERVSQQIPDVVIPDEVRHALATDRDAGVDLACQHIDALRASGAVAGVHLVPASRFRSVAARLLGEAG
jgi:5,10-methylenetetrahydrofolate reductase